MAFWYFTGVVAARRTPTDQNPLLRLVWRLRASLALTDCEDGVAHGAGPVEVHGMCDPCLHEDPGQVD